MAHTARGAHHGHASGPDATLATGSTILDAALGGGLPSGAAIILAAEEGAGGTEFAFLVGRHAHARTGRPARWLSALRSCERIEREACTLFSDPNAARGFDVRSPYIAADAQHPTHLLDGLTSGDLLILESVESLGDASEDANLKGAWRSLGDDAAARGIVILLIHTPATLPPMTEMALAQGADAVFRFAWHEGGPTRRRTLVIEKLRGLASGLDPEETPVFEVALERGRGFTISRERSVL